MDEIVNLGRGAMVIGGLDASYDFATLTTFLTRLEETDADPEQGIRA